MTPAPTRCRSVLSTLPCQRNGGHAGPCRNGLTVWNAHALPPKPRWFANLTAKELVR